jgi:N-acyl homoserine lactone hydrolase
VPLTVLPRVERLTLAVVTAVPDWHPEHKTFEPFPVHAWLIWHPDGIVLVDTGIGRENPLINEWYRPVVTPLLVGLDSFGVALREIDAVVLSHLHFDHCGQQALLDAPTYVQAVEYEAAQTPGYTVPEWADIPQERLRLVDGEEEILDGIRLLPTPGHTPGHQSVVVEGADRRIVLAAQCAYRTDDLRSGEPLASNLHAEPWWDRSRRSLEHIRSLGPAVVHLSHDPEILHLQ